MFSTRHGLLSSIENFGKHSYICVNSEIQGNLGASHAVLIAHLCLFKCKYVLVYLIEFVKLPNSLVKGSFLTQIANIMDRRLELANPKAQMNFLLLLFKPISGALSTHHIRLEFRHNFSTYEYKRVILKYLVVLTAFQLYRSVLPFRIRTWKRKGIKWKFPRNKFYGPSNMLIENLSWKNPLTRLAFYDV